MPMTDESSAAASRLLGSGLGEDFPQSLSGAVLNASEGARNIGEVAPTLHSRRASHVGRPERRTLASACPTIDRSSQSALAEEPVGVVEPEVDLPGSVLANGPIQKAQDHVGDIGQATGLVQAFETDLHQHVLRLVVTLVLEARHREKGQVECRVACRGEIEIDASHLRPVMYSWATRSHGPSRWTCCCGTGHPTSRRRSARRTPRRRAATLPGSASDVGVDVQADDAFV